MAIRISLDLPDDAWPGICDALAARRHRPDKIGNPAFDYQKPESDDNPLMAQNPETKEQFAIRSVMDYVAAEWAAYNKEQGLKGAIAAVDTQIRAREKEVKAATTAKIEVVG